MLEFCIREDLNKNAQRAMAVLNPLKVVIENYPEGLTEEFDALNNPEDPNAGTRKVPFSREIYIEQDDFMLDPPKNYYRLALGREVRLRYAYFIKCNEVIKDELGNVIELRCSYDPETRGGNAPDGRKVKGTIHWVSANNSYDAEIRLYDHLFTKENPEEEEDFTKAINKDSLKIIMGKIEPYLISAKPGEKFQFERIGYFCVDTKFSKIGKPVFNRVVTLKDTWAKIKQKL